MSGLIYGAIVLIWAAVLVPMWLKRHDDAVEAKSVDRFSTAMRVLARRTTAPDVGAVQTAPTPDMTTDPVDDDGEGPRRGLARLSTWGTGARRSVAGTAVPRAVRNAADRSAATVRRWARRPAPHPESVALGSAQTTHSRRRASMAVRRQRILGGLATVTVLAAVLAYLGILSRYVTVAVGLLLVAYLVTLRLNAKRAATAPGLAVRPRRSGTAVRESASQPVAADDASHTVKINPAPARRQATVASESPAATAAAAMMGDSTGRTASGTTVPDGFVGPRVGWDPVPVPSPTYVSAPRALRAVRSIDLSSDGAWTSGRLVADARAAAAAAVARSAHRDEDHEPSRRAVGD